MTRARRLDALWAGGSLLFALGLLGLWQVLSDLRVVNPIFFSSPLRTLDALREGVATGAIWDPLFSTLRRMLTGWLIACALGILLGALIASSRWASALLQPTLEFLRPLPASAYLPVAVLFLGLSDTMILVVVALGAVWPVLLGALHGFRSVEPRLVDVARMLHLGPRERLLQIALPSALPDILAGVRVSLALALILTVVGELIAAQTGVGYSIRQAQTLLQSPRLFAGLAVLGLLGFSTNYILQRAEAHWLRWRAAPSQV